MICVVNPYYVLGKIPHSIRINPFDNPRKASTFADVKSYYLCTRKTENDAPVAQLVEHLTLNQGVQSSSLCGCTWEGRHGSVGRATHS